MEESACVTTRRRSMRGSHKATSNKDSDSDSESNSNNNNSNDGGSRENSNIYEDAINRVILGDMSTPGKKRLPLLSKSSLNKETNDTIFSSGGGNGGNKILSRRAFAGEIFEAEEAGAARTNLMLDSAMSADAKDELFNALDNKFRAENRKKAGIAAADNMDLLDAAHGGGSSSDGSKSSSGSEYESAEEELHPLRSSSLMDGTALMSGKDMFSFRSSKVNQK